MKHLFQKISLFLFPWSYSENGSIRTHRVTGIKQFADYEDDWTGKPQVYAWLDQEPTEQNIS